MIEGKKTLSLKAAYDFGAVHGLEQEIDDIRNMVIEWDAPYTSTLRRGYIIALFEKQGLFVEFKKTYWPFGNTPKGQTLRNRFLKIKTRYEEFLAGDGSELGCENEEQNISNEEALEFALEAHLRDFLAKNLERVEEGLQLYKSDGSDGVEFSIERGYIDILAVDGDGKLVVIELKLSQGRNRALGQLLYYMGWIDQHMGQAPCRGLIIANDITEELSVAVSRVSGISLARYRMNFSIESI